MWSCGLIYMFSKVNAHIDIATNNIASNLVMQ